MILVHGIGMFELELCMKMINDSELRPKRTQYELGVELDFWISTDGCLMFQDIVCVPKDNELIQRIL